VAMVWATVPEVREYLGDRLPSTVSDGEVEKAITRAVRTLAPKVLRIPVLGDTDRPEDDDIAAHVVAAVGEIIAAHRDRDAASTQLGGMLGIVEQGGRIKAGSLEVDGTVTGGGGGYGRESVLPWPAVEALQAAGMVGGGVSTW
jgi:hypothetical protein